MKYVALPLLAFVLVGCAGPMVTPKPPTFQSKADHVSDWADLADKAAEHLASTLDGNKPEVYVAPGPADMPFAVAFRKLLEQDLLQRHFPVKESAAGALVVHFDTQTFLYRNDGPKLPVGYNTIWTTAYALGVQLRHVASLDTGAAIVAGAGPVLDALAEMMDTTNAEVLVTLTVEDDEGLYYRDTRTLYINPTELPFYWTSVPDFSAQSHSLPPLTDVSLPVRSGNR
jgi:hypothetical protein